MGPYEVQLESSCLPAGDKFGPRARFAPTPRKNHFHPKIPQKKLASHLMPTYIMVCLSFSVVHDLGHRTISLVWQRLGFKAASPKGKAKR